MIFSRGKKGGGGGGGGGVGGGGRWMTGDGGRVGGWLILNAS